MMKRTLFPLVAFTLLLGTTPVTGAASYDTAKAAAQAAYANREYESAAKLFRDALALAENGEDESEAQFMVAQSLLNARVYDAALKEYEKVLKVPGGRPVDRANAQINIGNCYSRIKKRDYAKACAAYEKALGMSGMTDALRLQALRFLGRAYYNWNKYDKARECLGRVYMDEKASAGAKGEALRYIALSLRAEKDYEGAVDIYRAILELEGISSYYESLAKYEIGRCYADMRQDEAMRMAMAKVAEVEEPVAAHVSKAWIAIGNSYLAENRFEDAIAAYQKVLDMEGASQRDVDEAREGIKRAKAGGK